MKQKIMVMIPTYNEKKNIAIITKQILRHVPSNTEVVFVDDNSPDNTAIEVLRLRKKNKRIHLLLRKTNKGRGFAGRAGYIYCLNKGADIIIEMDADLTHNPIYIPKMIKELKNYDVIIGSRFIKGGIDVERSFFRKMITVLSIMYIQLLSGINVKDCNSGYRCFRRSALLAIKPENLFSSDADIVQEVVYKLLTKKQRIKEIPIVFKERRFGETTKSPSDLIRGLVIVFKLRLLHLLGKL